MDGIDFLGRLMRLRPMPVVMISTLTERGAEVTMRALELGAIDFVAARVGVANGLQELASQIVDKIRVAAVAQVHRLPVVPHGVAARRVRAPSLLRCRRRPQPAGPHLDRKIIAIGASTGGTEAIRECSRICRPTARPSSSPSTCRRASPPVLRRGSTACAR
jgi:two-component system chemotaxis response regulator CheB